MLTAVSSRLPFRSQSFGRLRSLCAFCWRVILWVTWPFRRLPFKIGLAYTLTTLAVVILGELFLAGASGWVMFSSDAVPSAYADAAAQGASQLKGVPGSHSGGDLALAQQLAGACARMEYYSWPSRLGLSRSPGLVAAIIGRNGRVLACAPGAPFAVGKPLAGQLTPEDALWFSSVAFLPAGPRSLARRNADGSVIAAAPLRDSAGRRVGLLAVQSNGCVRPDQWALGTWVIILVTIPLVLLLGGSAGAIFGTVAVRPLTRRLQAMSATADAWGKGDFSAAMESRADDEVGELARRLGGMAQELRRHIRAQQKLAALEERNRLARDLHDTVKQQAFAAAMQLGAARTVLAGDDGPAGVFVAQAEKLTNKVQEDLMAIIHELRPAPSDSSDKSEESSDLSALLREEILEWSQMSGIPADVRAGEALDAPEEVRLAFLRIAQEALANAARHSRAGRVHAELQSRRDGSLHLTLSDNGEGFDPVFAARGMGLYSMRDRALSLPGGQFDLETKPGVGVTIRVSCLPGEAQQ